MGRNSGGASRASGTGSTGSSSSGSGRVSGGRTTQVDHSRSERNESSGGNSTNSSGVSYHSDPPPAERHREPPPPSYHRHREPPPPSYYRHREPPPPPYYDRPPRYDGWNDHMPPPPPPAYSGPGSYQGGRRNSRKGCCLPFLITFTVGLALLFVVFVSVFNDIGKKDTLEQAAQSVQEQQAAAEYFTDQLGWIGRPSILNDGMSTFYQKTGVMPYLYLTDNIDGNYDPSDEQMDAFTGALYDQLFTDENHFLLVFQEYGDYYRTWYVSGSDAARTVDEIAAEGILDLVDKYYEYSMDDETYFATVFLEAAKRITGNLTLDSLQWGMSQQEVLDALGLDETEVRMDDFFAPAEGMQPSKTLEFINCDRMYFQNVPIRVIFIFVTKNSEPAREIGLARFNIEILENSVETPDRLLNAVAKSNLGISIKWEELTEQQKEIIQEYSHAVYPESSGEREQMPGGNVAAEISVSDGTYGVYRTIIWDGEYPAVWNRFVLSGEKQPES